MAPAPDRTYEEVSGVLDKTALAQPGTTPRNQPDVAIGQVDHSAAASHGGDVGKAGLEESADHMTKPKLVAKKKPIVVEETDIMAFYLPMNLYVGPGASGQLYLPEVMVLTIFGDLKLNGPQLQVPVDVVLHPRPKLKGFEPVVQRGSLHYEEVGGEDRYVIAGVSTTGLGDYSWMVGLVVSNFKPGSLRRFAIFFEQREPCHAQRLDDLRVYLTNDKRMSASRLIIVNAQELACACTSAAGPRMALPAELAGDDVQEENLRQDQKQQQLKHTALARSVGGNVSNDDQLHGILPGKPTGDVGTDVAAAGHSGLNQQQVELLQRELGQVSFAGLDIVTFLSKVSSALLKVGLLNEYAVVCMHELIMSARKDGKSNILQGLSSRAKCICSAINRQQMEFVLHHTAKLVDDVVKYA